MGCRNPLVALAAIRGHDAQAGPREVEAVGAFLGDRDLGEDLLAGRDGHVWIMVEVDEPVRVFEHQHVIVGKVRDVKEGFVLGLDAEDRMAVGMARGGDDRDRAVEDLIAVFMDNQVRLECVERAADILDHLLNIVGAVRFREVGFLAAPEVDFLFEHVDGRVGEEDLTATGEAADVVDVRVAEQGVGHVFEIDTDGVHRIGEPAPVLVLVGAETGVDENHFLILTQQQDINVERHVVRTFADGHEGLGHLGTFVWRPHFLCYTFGESAVAVADGPRLELADREFIDVRIRNRLLCDRITRGVGRGLGGAEGGRNRQGGEGGAKASEELTAGVFGEGLFHGGMTLVLAD